MEHRYEITRNGLRLIAECLDLGLPLKLTRAAVGSGTPGEDADLADARELVHYVSDAAILGRKHEGDQLELVVRYAPADHRDVGAFTLSEFMVYALDPVSGQELGFLFASLGDYSQPVTAYSENYPASTWSFPLVLVVSGDLEVSITASPGLATFDDLLNLKTEIIRSIMMNELTLPLTTTDGEQILTTGGTPIMAVYRPNQSASILAAMEAMDGRLTGQIAQTRTSLTAYTDEKGRTALASANAYTDGKALGLERRMETDAGTVAGQIAAAKTEAISAAGTAADDKIAAHNTAAASHPTHLAIVQKS